MIRFSNSKITVVQSWSSTAIDLLAVFGRRRVITRFENLSEDAIGKGIEKAVSRLR
jgi:predicted Zn-dependent protease